MAAELLECSEPRASTADACQLSNISLGYIGMPSFPADGSDLAGACADGVWKPPLDGGAW